MPGAGASPPYFAWFLKLQIQNSTSMQIQLVPPILKHLRTSLIRTVFYNEVAFFAEFKEFSRNIIGCKFWSPRPILLKQILLDRYIHPFYPGRENLALALS